MIERDINHEDVENTLVRQGEIVATGDLPLRYRKGAY